MKRRKNSGQRRALWTVAVHLRRNNKFTLPQPINPHHKNMHASLAYRHASYRRFSRKPERRTYSFSWLFFDKRKSQKRCKEMLNTALKSPVRTLLTYSIPCLGCPDNLFCVPVMPVLGSDFACIRVWYCAFQPLKWAISHAETVLFAWRRSLLLL